MSNTRPQQNTTEILVIISALAGFSMMVLASATDLAVRTAVEIALIEEADVQ